MNNQPTLRKYIIIGFAITAIIIIAVVALIIKTNNESAQVNPKQTEYYDQTSGEDILDTEGKTPETYGMNPNAPILLGFVALYDRGLSQTEIDNTKGFLNDFADKQITDGKDKITQISLAVSSIKHGINRTTDEDTYTMNLTLNRKDTYTLLISSDKQTKIAYALYTGTNTSATPVFTASKAL